MAATTRHLLQMLPTAAAPVTTSVASTQSIIPTPIIVANQ